MPLTTPETVPADPQAAAEIGHAADQLANIVDTEATASGSLDSAVPLPESSVPSPVEEIAAMAATGMPAPEEVVPQTYQVSAVEPMSGPVDMNRTPSTPETLSGVDSGASTPTPENTPATFISEPPKEQ